MAVRTRLALWGRAYCEGNTGGQGSAVERSGGAGFMSRWTVEAAGRLLGRVE